MIRFYRVLVASIILFKYYRQLSVDSQISAEDMLKTLKADRHFLLFEESINQLQEAALYESHVHGKSHIARVAILSFVLGLQLNLNDDDLRLSLEIAKYHDVGRRDEDEDEMHGPRGARKIAVICCDFTDQEKSIIAAVIAAHSLRDDCYLDVFQRWDGLQESQYPKCKQLLDIIKDADALDRFRLRDNSLNLDFLRLENSVHLVRAACEMVHAFD